MNEFDKKINTETKNALREYFLDSNPNSLKKIHEFIWNSVKGEIAEDLFDGDTGPISKEALEAEKPLAKLLVESDTKSRFFLRLGRMYARAFLEPFRAYVERRNDESTPGVKRDPSAIDDAAQQMKNAFNQHLRFMERIDSVMSDSIFQPQRRSPYDPGYAYRSIQKGITEGIAFSKKEIEQTLTPAPYRDFIAISPEALLKPFVSRKAQSENVFLLFIAIANTFPDRHKEKTILLNGKEGTITFSERQITLYPSSIQFLARSFWQERIDPRAPHHARTVEDMALLITQILVASPQTTTKMQPVFPKEILIPAIRKSRTLFALEAITRLDPIPGRDIADVLHERLLGIALARERRGSIPGIDASRVYDYQKTTMHLFEQYCARVKREEEVPPVAEQEMLCANVLAIAQEDDRLRSRHLAPSPIALPMVARALMAMGPQLLQSSEAARMALERLLPEQGQGPSFHQKIAMTAMGLAGTIPLRDLQDVVPDLAMEFKQQKNILPYIVEEINAMNENPRTFKEREQAELFKEALEEELERLETITLESSRNELV